MSTWPRSTRQWRGAGSAGLKGKPLIVGGTGGAARRRCRELRRAAIRVTLRDADERSLRLCPEAIESSRNGALPSGLRRVRGFFTMSHPGGVPFARGGFSGLRRQRALRRRRDHCGGIRLEIAQLRALPPSIASAPTSCGETPRISTSPTECAGTSRPDNSHGSRFASIQKLSEWGQKYMPGVQAAGVPHIRRFACTPRMRPGARLPASMDKAMRDRAGGVSTTDGFRTEPPKRKPSARKRRSPSNFARPPNSSGHLTHYRGSTATRMSAQVIAAEQGNGKDLGGARRQYTRQRKRLTADEENIRILASHKACSRNG